MLLLARVIPSGDTTKVFQLTGVHSRKNSIIIDYRFEPLPAASSQIKYWLGVSVAKPLPPSVRFNENGRLICTLAPGTGSWLRPIPAKQ